SADDVFRKVPYRQGFAPRPRGHAGAPHRILRSEPNEGRQGTDTRLSRRTPGGSLSILLEGTTASVRCAHPAGSRKGLQRSTPPRMLLNVWQIDVERRATPSGPVQGGLGC